MKKQDHSVNCTFCLTNEEYFLLNNIKGSCQKNWALGEEANNVVGKGEHFIAIH